MNWEVAGLSDTGRRRRNNEDDLLLRDDLAVYAVADGMGGHVAGEVASRMAVRTAAAELETAGLPAGDPAAAVSALSAAILAANTAILADADREPRHAGMGTTLTTLALVPTAHAFAVAHVGDSRAYLLRAGRLEQLTHDHTWVQEQVTLGLLTPAEARSHPASSVLTRALGVEPNVKVEETSGDTAPGDVFLLCSDGLTGVVDDAAVADILARAAPAAELAADLVAAANAGGGPDNITVVVVKIGA